MEQRRELVVGTRARDEGLGAGIERSRPFFHAEVPITYRLETIAGLETVR